LASCAIRSAPSGEFRFSAAIDGARSSPAATLHGSSARARSPSDVGEIIGRAGGVRFEVRERRER
jgi:hypothetical protein